MIERNRFSKRQGNVTMMPDEEAAAALEKDITASSSSNLSLGQDITELPPQVHSPLSGCCNYLLPDNEDSPCQYIYNRPSKFNNTRRRVSEDDITW